LFIKEAMLIAGKKAEGEVTFEDVVSELESRRERNEHAHSVRRFMLDLIPEFPEPYVVGRAIGLDVYEGVSGKLGTDYGVPCYVNVTALPGKGRMYSTDPGFAKGGFEGPALQKANEMVFATLRKMLGGVALFDLVVDFMYNYEDTDGASASAAIMYAAISAISKVPMSQRSAITGVLGDFSARVAFIGGVMDKAEGWYSFAQDLCQRYHQDFASSGFGILIPATNRDELLMNLPYFRRMQAAVANQQYRIYKQLSILEGIDVLFPEPREVVLQKFAEEAYLLSKKSFDMRRGIFPRTAEANGRGSGDPEEGGGEETPQVQSS
jgi:predicted ATP-dependent protease